MSIEEKVQKWFVSHRSTLALAESCTGGQIAANLVALPGASGYFLGSFVVYSNELKESALGVSSETLRVKGAVSEEVVREMLEGVFKKTSADYGIAVSGIAGPSGGDSEKPVGMVFYALGKRGEVPKVGRLQGKGDRKEIIVFTSREVLSLLLGQVVQ